LPENLHPDLVVTIQPGDMLFSTPAPLTLPNRAGYAPGQIMDLWSINPTTGQFEIVGKCQVSADGSVINTIEGGIRNSSWHFTGSPLAPANPGGNPRNPTSGNPGNPKKPMDECGCDDPQSQEKSIPLNSSADLQSGAVEETHDLVSYQSLGITRGLSLHYDSLRADPRPIVHFGFPDINPTGLTNAPDRVKLVAKLSFKNGKFTYQVPGLSGGQYGLTGGENIWSVPSTNTGAVDAALQADLSALPSGQYEYTLESGIELLVSRAGQDQFIGTSTVSKAKVISINSVNSVFGSGWGLSGLQTLVENDDRSILLIDGNGIEQVFQAPVNAGDSYIAPPGSFASLVRLNDGTFRLTEKDQTVSTFNAQNQLIQVEDSNHNSTKYIYNTDGNLSQIVDPVGLTTTLSYTGNHVSTITDPAGLITQMDYDAAGNLLSITDPDGAKNIWEYDDKHHMTAHTDAQGERGTDSYNFAGRVSGAVRKDGSVVKIESVEVQGLYRPEQTINPDPFAAPSTFQLGVPISIQTDGNGNILNKRLDQAGQAVSVSDEIGTLSTVVRDSKNQVIQETDGNGNNKYYSYDTNGNMTRMKDEFAAGRTAPQSLSLQDKTLFSNPIYSQVSSPITADLDGDGTLDLISSDAYNSGLVSILFGDGKGHYSGPINLSVSSPNKLFVSDINQDHHLDLVTTSWDGTQINFLLNDGQRHFTSTTLSNPFSYQDGINSVSLSDLNGDGAPDLALTAAVYSGGGYGEFAAFSAASFGIDTVSAFAASSAPNNATYKVITLLNQGNGTFAPKTEYVVAQSADSVLAVDVNNDLKTDLITLSSNQNSVSVLLNQGNGIFATDTTYNSGTISAQVLYADLNRDGYIDLVTAGNYENQYSVLLNNGDGTFAAAQDHTISGTVSKIFLEDINNDGISDLLIEDAANDNILVSLNQGNGTFRSPTTQAVDGTPGTILFGDVNSDQQLDLVVSSSIYSPNSFNPDTKLTVFLNDGVNGFISPIQYNIPTFNSVQLQDFNGDGKLDLLGRDWRYGNSVLLRGNGDGSFDVPLRLDLPTPNYETGPISTPHALAVGLLDNDNIPDIVYSNYDRGYLSLSLSSNSTSNPLQTIYFPQQGPTAIVIGDINGDGHNDLALANGLDNTVSILFNNGDGNFTPSQTSYAVGALPQDLAFGDLNQDGLLDLVVADANGNEVSVLFNQGNGTFANAVSVSAGRNPYALAVEDINNDGWLDIVTANYLGGFSTLTNQGNGTFATNVYAGSGYTTTIPYGTGGTSIALGDINKDDYLDVVITNSNVNFQNNQTLVWLNQSNGSFGSITNLVLP
jgi:YD repeat-containing protein